MLGRFAFRSLALISFFLLVFIASGSIAQHYYTPTPYHDVEKIPTATIRFNVSDPDLPGVVNGATVSLFRAYDNQWIQSATTLNGKATLRNVPFGHYVAHVESPAHQTVQLALDVNSKKIRLNASLQRLARSPTAIASWNDAVSLQPFQILQVKRRNKVKLQITHEGFALNACDPYCRTAIVLKVERRNKLERIVLGAGEHAELFGRTISVGSLDESGNAIVSVFKNEWEAVQVNPV